MLNILFIVPSNSKQIKEASQSLLLLRSLKIIPFGYHNRCLSAGVGKSIKVYKTNHSATHKNFYADGNSSQRNCSKVRRRKPCVVKYLFLNKKEMVNNTTSKKIKLDRMKSKGTVIV